MAVSNPFVVTQDDVRLDEIVLSYYGDLTMFDDVLKANPNISEVHLSVGDHIIMPDETPISVEDVLW
jgi:hypothetical protein